MAIERDDLEREKETDRKVGIVKDAKRIAKGDVAGTLRDDVDELKADVKAADDKIEKAFHDDDDDDDVNRRYNR